MIDENKTYAIISSVDKKKHQLIAGAAIHDW